MLDAKREDASRGGGFPEHIAPAPLGARLFIDAMAGDRIGCFKSSGSGMGVKALSVFRTEYQPTQTGAARVQNTVNDIRRHAFALWGEQFDVGVIQFEQCIGGPVIGVSATPTRGAAQECTVFSACLSEVSDCDDDVVNGSRHIG